MPPADWSILPTRTADAAEAVAACRRDGASIYHLDPARLRSAEGAGAVPAELFGEWLYAAAKPMQIRNALFEGGIVREVTYKPRPDRPANAGGTTNESLRAAHTDSMGARMPDFILLCCAGAAQRGGENFIVDMHRIIDDFGNDRESSWLVEALSSRDVISVNGNTTSAATDLWLGPIAPVAEAHPPPGVSVPGGTRRRIAQGRRTFGISPARMRSPEAERDAEMVRAWATAQQAGQDAARRFRIEAGDCLLMDNFVRPSALCLSLPRIERVLSVVQRCAHGRDGYTEECELFLIEPRSRHPRCLTARLLGVAAATRASRAAPTPRPRPSTPATVSSGASGFGQSHGPPPPCPGAP